MKDTLVVFMTIRRRKDAQYRIDKAFSRILGIIQQGAREKNDDEVR